MLPFLSLLGDSNEHSLRDAEDHLATFFTLSDADRAELLPSGQQGIFRNRVGWARTYLKKAGLVEAPRRGVFKITSKGLTVLASNPTRIDSKYLEQFPEFVEFRDASKSVVDANADGKPTEISAVGGPPLRKQSNLRTRACGHS